MQRGVAIISRLLVVMQLVACGRSDSQDDAEVLVFAASSLTVVFEQFEADFEAEYPDIDVTLSFGASSALRVQIEQGAPADVIAVADRATADELVANGQILEPTVFATNSMTIAVPVGNPGNITSISDFVNERLLLGACAPEVPCGVYAEQIFAASAVEPSLDTAEPDVRSLVTKIASGELDAGLVYETDVLAADGELIGIAIAESANVRAEYPIAVLDGVARPAAQQFVDFVLSETGQRILADAGFGQR
jgi:molybdate transport system substrate-binding protein